MRQILPCSFLSRRFRCTLSLNKTLFDHRYQLLAGSGPSVQRAGRHGVVHFATRAAPAPSSGGRGAAIPPPSSSFGSGDAFALKFYINRAAFRAASELSQSANMRVVTRIIKEVLPNVRRDTTGGHMLPPCVVSRRGENLSAWARRVAPSPMRILPVLAEVAAELAAVHEQGFVYYALKASDIVWLEGRRTWVLADFGAVVPAGACPHPPAELKHPCFVIARRSRPRT
jgi:hypothetical protein